MVRDLPRSAALAAWGSAVLAGSAAIDDAVAAVQGDDLSHEVDLDVTGLDLPVDGLVGLIAVLRRIGARGLRLHLPAPGDPAGLPGPVDFVRAATAAGECVVTEGADPARVGPGHELALVPEVSVHGPDTDQLSEHDQVVAVTWVGRLVRPIAPVGADGGLSDCERELRTALARATSDLEQLDVASWREDAADGLARLRSRSVAAGMPPGTPSRAAGVLDLAWRVQAVLELAGSDDGGAVNGWESHRRREALREVGTASRKAVAAAVNAALEPASRPR